MKRLLMSVLAITAIVLPQTAAASGLFSSAQETVYVDNTYITSVGGRRLALCHQYEAQTLFGLGVGLTSQGYVLSETACLAPPTRENPGLINVAFASGALAGTPREPAFTPRQWIEGHAFFAVAGAFVLGLVGAMFALFGRKGRKGAEQASSRVEERREFLGLPDGLEFRAVDAMLHAAHAASSPSEEQIALIVERAGEITEMDYTRDHIDWVICLNDRLETATAFSRFGEGLTPEQAAMVLRHAVEVVTVNGAMFPTERRFIADLSAGLGLEQGQTDGILREVAPRGAPMPA